MTAPVATKVLPGQGPNCNSFFTRSFFIPFGNQADPPKPTNPEVFLETFRGWLAWEDQPTNPEVFLETFPAATIYAE